MYGSTVTTFQLITLITGVLLPIIVALVTKWDTAPGARAVLLLFLSGAAAVLNSWLATPNGFDWGQAIWGAVTTFIIGVATHFGLWRPTGVSDAAKRALVK
jgi:hypothetical protein